jgi:hypothetical protein
MKHESASAALASPRVLPVVSRYGFCIDFHLVAARAMRERALRERTDNPTSPQKTSAEVFFVSGEL